MLTIDDEQKVESFEVIDLTGKWNIFSKFEDGLVIIKMLGQSNSGMRSYHVKLYEDSDSRRNAFKVDVTSKTGVSGVTVQPLSHVSMSDHAVLFTKVTHGQHPVSGALVTAHISGPGGDIDLVLRDNGLG